MRSNFEAEMRGCVVETTVAGQPKTTEPAGRIGTNNQRRAWVILLSFFGFFCLACAVSGYGVNWFLFQSTVPLQAVLGVGRGTVGYIESDPFERVVREERRVMSFNENVNTDGQSQATILFRDTQREQALIAAVTMMGNTSLNLGVARRPRFEWSQAAYRIELSNVAGDVDVYVPPGLDREFWLSIQTRQGSFVYMMDSGQYTINASENQVQVDNYTGRALLISPDLQPHDVPLEQRATIITSDEGEQEVMLARGALNLLQPIEMQRLPPADLMQSNIPTADLMHPWQCGDIQSSPPGNYEIGFPDNRPSLRFIRANNASSHGETFCSLTPGPGQTGRDVSEFGFLRLRTTFRIEGHSLSACGVEGSECPVMLQLDYVYRDELGNEQPGQWFHGFYTAFNPLLDYPPRCASCTLDHDQIYPNKWYTYDSGNLFALLPPNRQPVSILRVKLYASGHEYDVYVSDMELLAG
jgi:hypothetical protein